MSSGNIFERLFKQLATILKLVVDGKRDAEEVSRLLQTIIDGEMIDISTILTGWKNFYQKFFGLDIDFSEVKIPEKKEGFDRLIVVGQGLTPNKVFNVCAKHFPCWRYTEDLDRETAGQNDREPTQTYTIWVRDRQEADEELKGLSANQLKERDVQGETLTERLLQELMYWNETGQHLDIQNWTLCTGSRDSGGVVPSVDWSGGGLGVGWYGPGYRDDDFRSRSAVSLVA